MFTLCDVMNDPSSQEIGDEPTDGTLLATANIYVDGVRVHIGIFFGLSTMTLIGNCSPIQ